MNTFNDLYEFIELAKNNRKYAQSAANNLRSALKIFEKELNQHELDSIKVLENNLEEIFTNLISKNKDKTIVSLNTYKARLIKVIRDYKRYGLDPAKIQGWEARHRQFTPVLKTKDNQDKNKIKLSEEINPPVENVNNLHRIELSLKSGAKAILSIPNNLTKAEGQKIKALLDSLTE